MRPEQPDVKPFHAPLELRRWAQAAFGTEHALSPVQLAIGGAVLDSVWSRGIAEGLRQVDEAARAAYYDGIGEGHAQATEGWDREQPRADQFQFERLNRPMVERLRQCAADTSPNWDGKVTVYPPEARELVALIDALRTRWQVCWYDTDRNERSALFFGDEDEAREAHRKAIATPCFTEVAITRRSGGPWEPAERPGGAE